MIISAPTRSAVASEADEGGLAWTPPATAGYTPRAMNATPTVRGKTPISNRLQPSLLGMAHALPGLSLHGD